MTTEQFHTQVAYLVSLVSVHPGVSQSNNLHVATQLVGWYYLWNRQLSATNMQLSSQPT